MQRRIRILPDHVANQIAAGEVVERPASVAKELIENSLDARADRVEIALRAGGKTELRVADDGHGMVREDALLAIDRHATSKIRDERDLRSIRSLGFRGEALPSIAAVSRFTLETAPQEGGAGTRIRIDGGRVTSVDEIARQPGTTVTVRRLFFNTPARAKFLRSTAAETRAISDVALSLALSNLSTTFRLVSNDRELFDLPRTADLASRVGAVWGEAFASQLIPLDFQAGPLRVAGLIQRPADTRPATRRTYLFINGRPFIDRFVVRAAEEGYRTTVPSGHRPALLLYLELPPEQVDVNVHPTKAEVRFRDKIEVEAGTTRAVRTALEGVQSAPALSRAAGGPSQLVSRRAAGPGLTGADHGAGAPDQMALFVHGAPARAAPALSRHAASFSRRDGGGEGAVWYPRPHRVRARAIWRQHGDHSCRSQPTPPVRRRTLFP
jgi:DNA mismatch repair protein MutL